jgi:DNA helicase HerA-like ATPase
MADAPADIAKRIAEGYALTGAALELGAVVLDGTAYPDAHIRIPLGVLNRHGLIAGATGTGKT